MKKSLGMATGVQKDLMNTDRKVKEVGKSLRNVMKLKHFCTVCSYLVTQDSISTSYIIKEETIREAYRVIISARKSLIASHM